MIFLDLALWIAMHEHQPLGNLYQSLLNIWICQLNYDCKNSQMKNLKKKFVLKVELTSEKSSFWLCYSETIEMLRKEWKWKIFFFQWGPHNMAKLVVQANDSPYGVVLWERESVAVDEPERSDQSQTLYIIRQQGMMGDLQVMYQWGLDASLHAIIMKFKWSLWNTPMFKNYRIFINV